MKYTYWVQIKIDEWINLKKITLISIENTKTQNHKKKRDILYARWMNQQKISTICKKNGWNKSI